MLVLSDALFIGSDELSALVGFVGAYVAAGVGMAFIFFALGSGFWLVVDFVRGV